MKKGCDFGSTVECTVRDEEVARMISQAREFLQEARRFLGEVK